MEDDKENLFLPDEIEYTQMQSTLNLVREMVNPAKYRRIELLIQIFLMIELVDLEQMETCIYEYGSLLKNEDDVGRLLFVRMADVIRHLKTMH